MDPDGLLWGLPALVAGGVGWVWGWEWLWIGAIGLMAGLAWFFRDPARRIPREAGAIVSPADGKVTEIAPNEDAARGPVPGTRVSIFLSVMDCHVNRAPCAGEVRAIRYRRGRFLNALSPASGDANESNWISLDCGQRGIAVRQIAGLIARRIVCRVSEGEVLERGQRIGLIRFGSRVELYLPAEARIEVRVGQKVRGGASVVAFWPTPQP